jgi:hypothetical protein
MTDNDDRRPTFLLHLRPEPRCRDAVASLRRALKVLLRTFHLRCVHCVEIQQPERNP